MKKQKPNVKQKDHLQNVLNRKVLIRVQEVVVVFIFGYQPKRTGELLHRQAAVQANYIPKLQMFPFKK